MSVSIGNQMKGFLNYPKKIVEIYDEDKTFWDKRQHQTYLSERMKYCKK